MKLEGSLDAFGLPDIFQLLSLTKKTGGLHLRSGASAGVVHFADGAVTGADADLARQTLARRLVGTGSVSDEALVSAVKRARSDGIGVGRALLDAGAVDPDLLRDAAAEVAYDAVFDLLSWPEGDFAFSPEAVNPDDVGMHQATEHVVAQAGTRQQALDSAADVIDSAGLVLAVPAVVGSDPELTRAEWALVALADGRRTVGEVVDLTGRSYYAVVPDLAALVRRGLLEVRGEATDHVTTVLRRLEVLATLEGPVADRRPTGDPATGRGPAANVPAPAAPAPAYPSTAAPEAVTVHQPAPARAEQQLQAQAPDQPVEIRAGAGREPAAYADVDPDDLATDDLATEDLATGDGGPELVSTVGGPHVPENVVPPRPEPFLARRQPDHPEADLSAVAARAGFGPTAPSMPAVPAVPAAAAAVARTTTGSVFSQPSHGAGAASGNSGGSGMSGNVGGVNGSAAMAADPDVAALIERDPSVNRSLLLRLIAGVRGL